MANSVIPNEQREFRCIHCDGKILIPKELPPTTGPCPHCSGMITSPESEVKSPTFQPPASPSPVPEQPASVIAPPLPPPVSGVVPLASPAPITVEPPKTILPPLVADLAKPPSTPVTREKKIEPVLREQDPLPKLGKPIKSATPKPPKRHRSGLIPAMLVLLGLIVAGGAVVYFASQELGNSIAPPEQKASKGDPSMKEANYIRIGWQKDAYKVLGDYMAATTSAGKVPYVLNGESLAPKIEDFYGGGVINDSDTPAEGFSIYELSEEDRKRGLFMMIYDLPPQFEMKEFFRPLASLEVQYGIDEADLLLSTLAKAGNFATDPMRVHAFFKRTSEGLKLDWEIFAQTKYRTFLNFVELPEPDQTGVFRVFIVEDVPEKGRAVAGTRTYRLVDPANTTDTARINVKIDSETGRALSIINWRGTKEIRPITRTATVELKWAGEPDAPELSINRFICWEFLGLGGQEIPATASTK